MLPGDAMRKVFGNLAMAPCLDSLNLMMHANAILLLAAGMALGGFLIIAGAPGRSARTAAYISIGSLLAALAVAMLAIIRRLEHAGIPGQSQSHALAFSWIPISAAGQGGTAILIQAGISSGSLSLAFFMMFLLILLMSQVHTLGLLKSNDIRPPYFALTNLMAFFLLMAALSINALETYFFLQLAACAGWCIMAWSNRPPETAIARKLLLPHWIGNAFFLMGIAIFMLHGTAVEQRILFGHTELSALGATPGREMLVAGMARLFPGLTWQSLGGVCLLAGALVQAGQFPFHTWVPETVTGFSGGNAMISGSLVAAGGILLLTRMAGLLNLNAALTVAMMGAVTQFCAALIALVQKDIKRTLAWLLIAQTGLNFLFFGSGDYAAGLVGAMLIGLVYCGLFLAAGTVLRATGGQRDMTLLGGVWRRLPITAAVSGALVLGVAGTGSFGMTAVMRAGLLHAHAYGWAIGEFGRFLYWSPVVLCYVTALALARWWWLVFGGRSRGEPCEGGELAVQTFPLLIILVSAVIAAQPLVDMAALLTHLMQTGIGQRTPHVPAGLSGMLLRPLAWLGPTALALVALFYSGGMASAQSLRRLPGPNLVYRWLTADMYFPDLFIAFIGFPVRLVARAVAFLDRWVVEWLMVTLAVLIRLASILVAAAENGLNTSFWERLDGLAVRMAQRVRQLRRVYPALYVTVGLVLVIVAAVLAAVIHQKT